MTYFTEIDRDKQLGGKIVSILPGSAASTVDLKAGDQLLAVNGQKVDDIIDVQFYGAEEELELLVRRDGEYLQFDVMREYDQPLGLEFQHPTFDTDIRRCNNLCEFCFVLQMAPRFRRTLYIKDDDYRYSFLFGHYVTLTNLDEHDWWKIINMGLSPLYVSVHSTDLEIRRRFLRNNAAPNIMDQLKTLAAAGITLHTQLVIVPGLNDGPDLDKSINELASLYPSIQSVTVVPVGLTHHHKYGLRTHTPGQARVLLENIERHQARFRNKSGVGFVYATDEWYLVSEQQVPPKKYYDGQELHENGLGMVRDFLDESQRISQEITSWKSTGRHELAYKSITLVTGTLFHRVLTNEAKRFSMLTGCEVKVVAVENKRLGASITVAGLLMAEDVIKVLEKDISGEVFILPRIMFDHPDNISLDDISPQEISSTLNRPVVLADQMGDVWDAVLGQPGIAYYTKTSDS